MTDKPSADAVQLMHRLRTVGRTTEFAVPDQQAALQIEEFAARVCEPMREALRIAEKALRDIAARSPRPGYIANKADTTLARIRTLLDEAPK